MPQGKRFKRNSEASRGPDCDSVLKDGHKSDLENRILKFMTQSFHLLEVAVNNNTGIKLKDNILLTKEIVVLGAETRWATISLQGP